MNILIHDMEEKQFQKLFSDFPDNICVIKDNKTIKSCTGCFGCWIKTPGKCVIKDGYENIGRLFSEAKKITVITRCTYGCYSPFVKNVLDRSLSYLLPSFEIINKETHHKQRYVNSFAYSVYFYGENITESERKTAEALVKSNAVNYHCTSFQCGFFSDIKLLGTEVKLN